MTTASIVKKLATELGTAIVTLGVFGTAQAATIIVPNSLATQEGNINNSSPFDLSFPPGTINSQRYQQVYAASQFLSLLEPELITQISFRPDGIEGRAFSTTLPNIQINLSTTRVEPQGKLI